MGKYIASLLSFLFLFSALLTPLASEPYQGDSEAEEELALEASDRYDISDDGEALQTISTSDLTVNAASSVLMEANSGKLLYENNSHERRSPASVTKIMTLLLVMEALDAGTISLEDKIAASPEACAKGGSQIWLEPGEEMTVHELLKATAVGSANDASVALAEHIAGSEEGFVAKMNERAAELGMVDTNFENCTGLDDTAENHYSSAYDVALMSCELVKHERIFEYTTIWMDSLRDGQTELVNTNKLVRFYDGITGLKTGTTSKAGKCLSASARRDNMHLVAVVLGSESSDDRFNGARNLLNWGFANYTVFQPEVDYSQITPVKISFGMYDSVVPVAEEVPYLLIEKGREQDVKTTYSFNDSIEAPVEKGQILGRINISLDSEELGQICLVSPESIERMNFPKAFGRLLEKLLRK